MPNQNLNITPPDALTAEKQFHWNVVITVRDESFREAKHLLHHYGIVKSTKYYNLLVMQVQDINEFLHDFGFEFSKKPYLRNHISRITPVMQSFIFNTAEEFENKAKIVVEDWLDQLKEKTFYVRMHRRGFKQTMSSLAEEQFLDQHIVSQLQLQGSWARIAFDDPDFVIDVETVNNQAGLSFWTRQDLSTYPFINLD